MECEECGSEEKLYSVIVDGKIKQICAECARKNNGIIVGEKIVEEEQKEEIQGLSKEDLVNEFHIIIRKARERKGLTLKQVADAISESETLISKIEKGFIPQEKILKKIEQFLRIKVINPFKLEIEKEKIIKERVRNIVKKEKEKKESTKEKIKIPKEGINIDFKSKDIKIADLKKLKEKISKE